MKTLTFWLCAATLFLSTEIRAQHWQWVTPVAYVNSLNEITFADSQHGWAVGDSGHVAHSTDGGETWIISTIPDGASIHLKRIGFSDPNHGWILGHGISDTARTIVYHTTNSGSLWTREDPPLFEWVQDFAFPNSRLCLFTGYETVAPYRAVLLRSTDGGATWDSSATGLLPIHPNMISFPDSLNGWISGGVPDLLHTTDGGQTWALQTTGDTATITCMRFLNSLHGWFRGSDGHLRETNSGGETWMARTEDCFDFGTTLQLADTVTGWGIHDGRVYRTTDAGTTWNESNHDAIGLWLAADHSLWIAGYYGMVYHSTDGGVSWTRKAGSDPIPLEYFGISSPDTVNIWLMANEGWRGVIVHSIDGGISWRIQSVFDTLELFNAAFSSSQRGYALSYTNITLRTDDGGGTWHAVRVDPWGDAVTGFAIMDNDHLSIATYYWDPRGALATIRQTTNAGATWSNSVTDDLSRGYDQLTYTSEGTGWVVGNHHLLRRYEPDGEWEIVGWPPFPATEGQAIAAVGRHHCWVITNHDSLVATTDGGLTWQFRSVFQSSWNRSMHFSDSLNGWRQDGSSLEFTADGGMTWTPDSINLSCTISAWSSVDANHVWACTNTNRILRYVPSQLSVRRGETTFPSTLRISCAPNPFNPSTEIFFTVPTSGRTTLKVYDITGREVSTLSDQIYSQGEHHTAFDGSSLASGLYFVRLEAHGLSNTQKVILLR